MKHATLTLFIFTFFLGACNQVYYYKPATQQPDNTQTAYNHGLPNLVANTGTCEITAEMVSRGTSNFLDLGLFITNQTDSMVTFFPDQVKAYGFDAKGNRKELRVYTAKEFVRYRNTRNAIIIGTITALAVAGTVAASNVNNGGDKHEQHNHTFISSAPFLIAPLPPYASHDGLLREHTMYERESLAGNIMIRKNDDFNQKYLLEVPVNGKYVKFVFDEKTRRY